MGTVKRLLQIRFQQIGLAHVGARIRRNVAERVHPAGDELGRLFDDVPAGRGVPCSADDDVGKGVAPGWENRGVGWWVDGDTGAADVEAGDEETLV